MAASTGSIPYTINLRRFFSVSQKFPRNTKARFNFKPIMRLSSVAICSSPLAHKYKAISGQYRDIG